MINTSQYHQTIIFYVAGHLNIVPIHPYFFVAPQISNNQLFDSTLLLFGILFFLSSFLLPIGKLFSFRSFLLLFKRNSLRICFSNSFCLCSFLSFLLLGRCRRYYDFRVL